MGLGNRKILIFKDIEEISNFIIKKWFEIAKRAIKEKGRFTVALSGGKTPQTLYQKLAELKDSLPWDKTEIFLVDERFVPCEDSENNYRMINQTLLSRIKIPEKNIHPISTKEKTPKASARKYEEELTSYFKLKKGEFPRFDLILLGMGEDGHTASLFPDTTALTETEHFVIAVSPPDISKKERISLTLPVINNADNVIFLITGVHKAKVLKEVIEDKNCKLPAAMVSPEKGMLFFLIDKAAALYLSRNTI
jgi:6-phosphogluconolactonase